MHVFCRLDDVEKENHIMGKLEIHQTKERRFSTIVHPEVHWRSDTSHGRRREEEEVHVRSKIPTMVKIFPKY